MNTMPNALRLSVTAAALGLLALAPDSARAQSPEKGLAAYMSQGCWQCHGTVGQGGAGTKIAPGPMPLNAMAAFLRNTNGRMPPYKKAILSDAELADIHAYLESIPRARDYKTIPALNP